MSRLGKSFKNRFLRRALAMVLAGTMVMTGMPVSFATETSDVETVVETEVQGGTEEASEEASAEKSVEAAEDEELAQRESEETETKESENGKSTEASETASKKESASSKSDKEAEASETDMSTEVEETEVSETDTDTEEASENEGSEEENEATSTSNTSTYASTEGNDKDLVKYNMEGFASSYGVTGGGLLTTENSNYHKVSTEKEFLDVLLAKGKNTTSKEAPTVIEITADMNLGNIELKEKANITVAEKDSEGKIINNADGYGSVILKDSMTPLTHPTLKKTGVSLLTLQNLKNLTIFSKNGSSIKHCGIVVKKTENLIIRNITFDELWEWDDLVYYEAKSKTDTSPKDSNNLKLSEGAYDRNDWDYMCIDSESDGVWIDHCTFYKAYDGVIDIKNPKTTDEKQERVTISWCKFEDKSAPDENGNHPFYDEQIKWLKENESKTQYYRALMATKGTDVSVTATDDQIFTTTMSATIKGMGFADAVDTDGNKITDALIEAYTRAQKKTHLFGQGDTATNAEGIRATLANNTYKNSMDRMPRLRFGKVHEYNCVLDSQELYKWKTSQSTFLGDRITSNGASSTCNGEMLLENCYISGIVNPLNSGNGSSPTGYINAVRSVYYKDGVKTTLEPKKNGSGSGDCKVTDADDFVSKLPYSDYIKYNAESLITDASLNLKGAGKLSLSEAQWEKTSYGSRTTTEPDEPESGEAPTSTEEESSETPSSSSENEEMVIAFSLSANDISVTEIISEYPKNSFIIKATDTKKVTVVSSDVTIEDKTFTKAIQLGGAGTKDNRSIHFTANKPGKLIVYAKSTGSDDRTLGLYKFDGSTGTKFKTGAATGKGAVSIYDIGETQTGNYYIQSEGSGINIYYIAFTVKKTEGGEVGGSSSEDESAPSGSEEGPGDSTSSSAEESPSDTASSGSEESPSDTASSSAEESPSDTASSGSEESPSDTASSSAEESPSDTASSSSEAGPGESETSSSEEASSESETSSTEESSDTESKTDTFYDAAEGNSEELTKYNIEGYAAAMKITGGGLLKEGSANYYKVTNEKEFIDALNSVRSLGTEGGLKPAAEIKPAVIEIVNDLNLGYKELLAQGIDITQKPEKTVIEKHKKQPLMHPTLKETGVSYLKLNYFHNLTIYSKNGASIKHCGIYFEGATSNIIIRNITFDEFWEWDEKTSGDYDENDWDYMTVYEQTDGLWIDHCTFYKAYDGILDIKGDSKKELTQQRVTISWCEFLPGSKDNTFFNAQMDYLETNKSSTKYYKKLRDTEGMSKEDVWWYAYGQKKTHLFGAADTDEYASMIRATLANNYYKNSMDRMPRLRFGKVHEYNCILDAQELYTKKTSGNSGLSEHITSNGAISTCGGEVLLENCYISGIKTPLNSGNGESPTGYINAVDSLYYLDGVETALEPKRNGSGTGELLITDADKFREALPYSDYVKYDASKLEEIVKPNTGAGKLTMTTVQWEKTNYGNAAGDNGDDEKQQLEKPTATPAAGEVEAGTTVSLSAAEGATIYYTTDGTDPTAESTPYTAPIEITEAVTIKAIAVMDGWKDSEIAEFAYTVKEKPIEDDPISNKQGIQIEGLEESYEYTGAKIIPDIDVWDYDVVGGKLLAVGVDYTVSYKDNVNPGTATIAVSGKGNYAGQDVTKRFKIEAVNNPNVTDPVNVKGAKIDITKGVVYNGAAQYPDFTLTLKGGSPVKYTEDKDADKKGIYKRADGAPMDINVAVSNNINKGTATILVTGKASTSVKKTFKITPIDLSQNSGKVEVGTPEAVEYAVSGAVPETLTIKYDGRTLKNGKDYTLKYANNKKKGTGSITVTGKGNYAKKYSRSISYTINALDLSKLEVSAVTACDGVKAGKIKATVVDGNGTALKASQYTINVYKEDGSKYTETEQLRAGTVIYVEATAKDKANLSGTTVKTEFKVGRDISKAKFVLKKQKQYTGNAIILEDGDLTVTMNGASGSLKMGEHYEIVAYSNNINKGTATAIVKGIGDYSGTKTIKFKITQKPMKITTSNAANP